MRFQSVDAPDQVPDTPNPPRESIAALRRILSTIDPDEQPHAYWTLRSQLDDAIARKLKEPGSRPPD